MRKQQTHWVTAVDPETRTGECAHCGPVSLKRRNPRTPDGAVRWSCKKSEVFTSTQRRRGWVQRYGMTVADYDAMEARQNGVCAICGGPPRAGSNLHIDHDHACCPVRKRSCGKCVRGLLCPTCNVLLHHFDADPDFVDRITSYLAG